MASSVAVHSQQNFHTPQQSHPDQSGGSLPPGANPAAPVWQNPNPPLPRGRAPRDPLAVTTKLQCTTLQDMEKQLRDYLDNPPAAPEHCTCELTLWAGASFLVKLDYIPPNLRGNQQPQDMGMLQAVADFNNQRPIQNVDGRESTLSVLDALQQLGDPKETMKRQRAISKVCVAAVQRTDGYRYSFHNSWKSGEDNAYRFSYYCNDSLLNKDRVANGKSGSQGKRATKPVYDCKGVLSIKFSATRQCIDVVYRHIPCHETYEERAPPPRKNSKRRAEWESKNPERIKPPKASEDPESTPSREPPKKKKKKDSNEAPVSAEAALREQSMFSLLELMRPPEPKKPEQPPEVSMPNIPSIAAGPVSNNPAQAQATTGAQKTPSRRQPKNATQCAVCIQRRTKCDGQKPKCRTCNEKGWYCFYQPENAPNAAPNANPITNASVINNATFPQPQLPNVSLMQNAPSMQAHAPHMPTFNPVHAQNEMQTVALTSQNEELTRELSNFRQEQQNAQKEALELKNQLAEMKKQLDSLKAENTRLNQPPQPQPVQQSPMAQQTNMNPMGGHERTRSSQQHHHLPSAHQPSYATQYQTNAQHMYHQPTQTRTSHSTTHGQPVYQTQDNRAQQQPNAWNTQGLYGAYQQSQHSGGMLPSTHMMGGYR